MKRPLTEAKLLEIVTGGIVFPYKLIGDPMLVAARFDWPSDSGTGTRVFVCLHDEEVGRASLTRGMLSLRADRE
jgi:hypothetical protein